MIFKQDKSPDSLEVGVRSRSTDWINIFIRLRSFISQHESYIWSNEDKRDISSDVSKLTSFHVPLFRAELTRELIISVNCEVANESSLTKKHKAFLTCSFSAVDPADWDNRSKKLKNERSNGSRGLPAVIKACKSFNESVILDAIHP